MSKPLQILLVDDDDVDRLAVRRALRQGGLRTEVHEVASATVALAVLHERRYDCVLADYYLPDGEGLALIEQVRAAENPPPIIVLTGQGDERIVALVMKAGAADYLPKVSITSDQLERSLRGALRYQEAQRQAERAHQAMALRERAIAAASNGVTITDPHQPNHPIIYCNPAFLAMTGYTEHEVLGHSCRFLQGQGSNPEAVRELREAIRAERDCQVLILNYRKTERLFGTR